MYSGQCGFHSVEYVLKIITVAKSVISVRLKDHLSYQILIKNIFQQLLQTTKRVHNLTNVFFFIDGNVFKLIDWLIEIGKKGYICKYFHWFAYICIYLRIHKYILKTIGMVRSAISALLGDHKLLSLWQVFSTAIGYHTKILKESEPKFIIQDL